ncbi:hypothetical protein [Sinomonas halotolerans]|uniref:Uncharacterized protein n=1 Tax=Sinomonas halotolerans TaxID=1644133 RepID=A0ABU9X209_9MICC
MNVIVEAFMVEYDFDGRTVPDLINNGVSVFLKNHGSWRGTSKAPTPRPGRRPPGPGVRAESPGHAQG